MSVRARSSISLALGAGLVAAVSCTELGGPGDGVFAISPLLLPSPGMVVGDTMRDSLGVAAPLRVVAFKSNGDTMTGTMASFITLDTNSHLVGGTVLVADYLGGARVLGSIGSLQTLPETVKVTLRPDTLFATDSIRHVRLYSFITGDTLVSSAELTTRVVNDDGATITDVDAVIVKYAILSAPPPKGSVPTVTLQNGGALSDRDTTATGRASRTVRLRVKELTSLSDDSAVVRATASHRGVSLGTVTFTVVFRNQ